MAGTFQRLQESLNEAKAAAAHKINNVTTVNEKILDMWGNTVSVEKSGNRQTTDAGVKVEDTDHWLKIVGGEKQGPGLLEDQIGRERVGFFFFFFALCCCNVCLLVLANGLWSRVCDRFIGVSIRSSRL
jgi:catalase